MKLYELTYLLKPGMAEEELNSFRQKLETLVQSEGGVLDKNSALPKKNLAYPIDKHLSAHVGTTAFYLEPDKLSGFHKKLKSEEVLRVMLRAKRILAPGKKVSKASRRKMTLGAHPLKPKAPKVDMEKIEEKIEELLR